MLFRSAKHSVSRLSYLFSHLHLLSSYSLSSTLLSSNLSLLSASSLLCFSSVHTVGSLTSKLPSIRLVISIGFVQLWRCNNLLMVGVLAARRTARRSTDRCVRLLPVLACLLSDMFNSFLLLACFISSHICGQVVVFVVVATTGRAQLRLEQHCATQT